MDNLTGKTILIGKDPSQARFAVAVDGKIALMGAPGSVPGSVSRCMPQQGVAHAKIDVGINGAMTITNLKPQNVTFVDGTPVMSKRVASTSSVALGMDRYPVSIAVVLTAAQKIVGTAAAPQPPKPPTPPPTPEKEFNIVHLYYIWEDYHNKTIARQKRMQKLNLISSASLLFSLGGGSLMALGNTIGLGEVASRIVPILTVLGFIVCAVSFYMRSRDKSIDNADSALEEFQQRYVCPNPSCGKYLNMMSYKLMKKQYNMHCPFCKCKFVEK